MGRVSKLVGALVLHAASAQAQTAPEAPATPEASTKVIAVEAAVVVPLADYADEADVGFGAFGRFELRRGGRVGFGGRAGVLAHVGGGERRSLLIVPVLGMVSLPLGAKLSVHGGAGATYIRRRFDPDTNSSINFAFGFGGGYRSGRLEARLEILVPDFGAVSSSAGLMASVGIDLTSL